ncbi:glycosyl transferase [Candidatus Symbiothrix dinenymphae]|nr:glycosyl transferase [Candidatus Symbiothrix dinenymphae]
MNTINYSIIIPHKNIPKLLERCLASIPQRDDIQVIVVDDNSDADIVETWRATSLPKYPHVEFVFAKNKNGRKGAGYARNIGLEHAKGKWIVFADADDFFMPCVDEAMTQYADDEHDVVFFFLQQCGFGYLAARQSGGIFKQSAEAHSKNRQLGDCIPTCRLLGAVYKT